MKDFFDDVDWELTIGITLILSAVALGILAPILALVYCNAWLILLWIPAIVFTAFTFGKGLM